MRFIFNSIPSIYLQYARDKLVVCTMEPPNHINLKFPRVHLKVLVNGSLPRTCCRSRSCTTPVINPVSRKCNELQRTGSQASFSRTLISHPLLESHGICFSAAKMSECFNKKKILVVYVVCAQRGYKWN